jgi:hypothetical protein
MIKYNFLFLNIKDMSAKQLNVLKYTHDLWPNLILEYESKYLIFMLVNHKSWSIDLMKNYIHDHIQSKLLMAEFCTNVCIKFDHEMNFVSLSNFYSCVKMSQHATVIFV